MNSNRSKTYHVILKKGIELKERRNEKSLGFDQGFFENSKLGGYEFFYLFSGGKNYLIVRHTGLPLISKDSWGPTQPKDLSTSTRPKVRVHRSP